MKTKHKLLALALLIIVGCTSEEDFCPCVETLYEKRISWETLEDGSSVRHLDTVIVYQKNVPLQQESYFYMGYQFKTIQCFKPLVNVAN